jgi:hypothetical protein
MTMPYAEEELVAVLEESCEGAPANPARADQVVSRGRRMRHRRRAGRVAVAATGVAALVAVALAGPGATNRTDPSDAVPVSVRLPVEVPLPGSASGFSREMLPLIETVQRERMGERTVVKFTALSTDTLSNIRCSVPGSWVFVQTDSPGRAGSLHRCTPGDNVSQFERRAAGDEWAGRPRTWEVWVLPPDAPITYETDPEEIPALADKIGRKPGAWAIGIYDRKR